MASLDVRPVCGSDCLEFLDDPPDDSEDNPCRRASARGHLECLRFAHQHGCPWDWWTPALASGNGHLDCLAYAHRERCPWNWVTCSWASARGHRECLRYALEHGVPANMMWSVVHPDCLPVWYHHLAPFRAPDNVSLIPDQYSEAVRHHRRDHVRRAWSKLRLVVRLLKWYNTTCETRYAPDGVGYREAEADFQKLIPVS